MLKLTYTENSFYIECLNQSLEEWVSQRVILALRVSQSLFVQPSTASFLLPADLPGLEQMKASFCCDDREIVSLYTSDAEYVEVTLYGSWLCNSSEDANGVFVAKLSDRTEFFLHKLWQEAQACISAEC
ncbi:alr0857 family protein [Calothrix sp. 336/3]|uniref:alr0857 family protein n=1 Tax=Calothrix sp. 336/3 TaxID=1337936 RepID=UPI0004E338D3|nr:alr0857 family protein [Calothrix sp. 336/3]AKG22677.1 hypothetical protein IJ00_16605 [Calothrix sp. 336/3]